MKRSLLLIFSALFSLLILCGGSILSAQEIEQNLLEEKKEYTYPVSPDKNPEEWKALCTLSDKLKATRIDEDTLSGMTLDGLTKAILDYPLLINIGIYNSDKENYDCFLSQCDAFRELIGRKGGREALVQCYIELTEKLKTDEAGYRNYGDKALKVFLLEMLIANPYFAKEVDEDLLQSAVDASILYNQGQENSFLAAMMKEMYKGSENQS